MTCRVFRRAWESTTKTYMTLNVAVGTTTKSLAAVTSMWFRMKVPHRCEDFGSRAFTMYFATVDSERACLSRDSSAAISGAPQVTLYIDMSRMRCMSLRLIGGLLGR